MSTVMRPRGPLPGRVYWTRRALLVALVLVALVVGWWLMPGSGGSGPASADPGAGTTTTPTGPTSPANTQPTEPTQTHTSTPPSTTNTSPHTRGPVRPPTSDPPSTTTVVPTGPCDPAKVHLVIDVDDAVEGAGTKVRLQMATTDGSTCTLGISPNRLEVRITTHPVTVWHSTSCPDGLPARNVVVGPKPAAVYSFRWDGHIDPNACQTGPRVAGAGGYWVKAALIGGAPANRAYFDIVAGGAGNA